MAVSTIDALYNGGSEKVTATSTGIDVTGTVTADAIDITESTNARLSSSDAISEVGSGTFALQATNAAGSALKPLGFRAEDIRFATGSSERMRIDSSGNVGIGCTPSYKLDVASTVQIRAGESLRLQNVAGSSAATIQCAGAGGNSDLGFSTGGTERMRITTTRLLYSTGSMADITASNPEGVAFAKYTGQGIIRVGNTSTGGRNCVEFFNGNGQVGSILTSGSATSYNTSSDYRLKTDAQPMVGATARVQALNPVNFEWIADGSRVDGFLAHEAQEVVPESVTGTKDAMRDEEYEVTAAIAATYDDDGNELTAAVDAVIGTRSVPDMQGIDQSKLVPLLTAALQEALTEIAALKARVTTLEG